MEEKITTKKLLTNTMSYFRFDRQWFCVDECLEKDILVKTNTGILEVELKISKSDLIQGEKRKAKKHSKYKNLECIKDWAKIYYPNKFAFCVPEFLEKDALNLIEELNNNYGLYLLINGTSRIVTKKTPKNLHNKEPKHLIEAMYMRASSSIINKLEGRGI